MGKIITSLKLFGLLFLLVSAKTPYWIKPAIKAYEYPKKHIEEDLKWYESPSGIFSLGNNANYAPIDIYVNTQNGLCTASVVVPEYGESNLSWTMDGATTNKGTGEIGTFIFEEGVTTVTYQLLNILSLSFQVTVFDDEAPHIATQEDFEQSTDAGKCTATVSVPDASYDDNCLNCSIAWEMTGATTDSGSGQVETKVLNIGVTTITYTATDGSNNTSQDSIEITIKDQEDPSIRAASNFSQGTDTGKCTATVKVPDATFNDNCSGSSLTWNMSGATSDSGSGQIGSTVLNIGVTTITYTVTDASNNSSQDTVQITIEDHEDPILSVTSDFVQSSDPNSCTASINIPNVSFSDNCSVETLNWVMSGVTSDSGTGQVGTKSFNLGTTNIAYTVIDAAGNTQDQNLEVTVIDEEIPVITHNGDKNLNSTPGTCGAEVTINATASDNCSVGNPIGIRSDNLPLTAAYPVGVTTITWNIADASLNEAATVTQTVTVTDKEKPVIIHNGDKNLNSTPGTCGAEVTVSATSTDNCSVGNPTGIRSDGQLLNAPYPVGTTTITWNVTDANFNEAIPVTQTITVSDLEKPVISHNGDQNVNSNSGTCGAQVTVSASATDNCSVGQPTGTRSDGKSLTAAYPVGTTTITWNVADNQENEAIPVTQTIIVTDLEKPVISHNGDQNVNSNSGTCGAQVTISASATDNCSVGQPTGTRSDGKSLTAAYPVGTTTITWNVADANGNTATEATQTIIVVDNEKPEISHNGDHKVDNDPGECGAYIEVNASTSDNCTVVDALGVRSDGEDLGEIFPVGTTSITWTATDIYGNQANPIIQTVTVNDNEAPTTPELPDLYGECPFTIDPPTIFDNCGGSITGTTGISDLTFYESTSVFWVFTDSAGNSTEPIEQMVTVVDTQAPKLDQSSLPKKTLTGCQISSISELDIPTATDACSGKIYGKLSDDFQFPYSFFGSNTVTWEFIDNAGNIITQQQEIQLNPVSIEGGSIRGIFNSSEFQKQIDISSCGARITVDLQLSENIGTIVQWEKFAVNEGFWEIIPNNTTSYTANFSVGALESTYYRVLIKSGTCTEYSESFYIRALPAGDAPTVTNLDESNKYCLGDDVNLLAESNYLATQPAIPSGISPGDFNQGQLNTQDPDSWLVDGDTGGFTAGGNSKKPRNWSGTNNHEFGGIEYDSEDGKFAIAQGDFSDNQYKGDNPTTLESPIIDLTNAASASLEFDQAYYFANNDVAIIQISIDGGRNYSNLRLMHGAGTGVKNWFTAGTAQSTTGSSSTKYLFKSDNTSISLDDYIGQSKVRIRWLFKGTSDKSVWAMDNIVINNDVPVDTELEWTNGIGNPDENPIEKGQTSIPLKFKPQNPGAHQYGATALIAGCRTYDEDGTDLINILVSHSYAGQDIIQTEEQCGQNTVQLNAYDNSLTAFENAEKGAYPGIPDECVACDVPGTQELGTWSWTGDESCSIEPSFSDIHDANATFTAGSGTYILTWTVDGCSHNITVTIKDCDQIDFDGTNDYVDFGDNYELDEAFSLEVWIKPKSVQGTRTIFSKRDANYSESAAGYDLNIKDGFISFNWDKNGTIASPHAIKPDRWYHVAVTHSTSGNYKLYIDGIELPNVPVGGNSPSQNDYKALLGAMDSNELNNPKNNFYGWIDELRIWKSTLTKIQIRRMMNQRIKADGSEVTGEIIPITIPNLTWSNLRGYYRMDQFASTCGNINSFVGINGKLVNITTSQEISAPLPYTTSEDGLWFNNSGTWTHADVWDPPFSPGINDTKIDWNIAQITHEVKSDKKDVKLLGLLVEPSGKLDMQGNVQTSNSQGSGNRLTVTHYLDLNGHIDLNGESQLVQPEGSLLVGSGYLDRDQQGTASSFNYNYWSSPVVKDSTDTHYIVGEVMMDGSYPNDSNYPLDISYEDGFRWADDYTPTKGTPIHISNYWIHAFYPKDNEENAGQYSAWIPIHKKGQEEPIRRGEGYSMKGSRNVHINQGLLQNYTFKGFPNNGNITTRSVLPNQNYLIGNPYPSAIDANKFIKDNLRDVTGGNNSQNVFNGSLYFWSHFAEKSHYLTEYVGGYAVYNLSGGIRAISNDARIDNSDPNRTGGEIPRQYISVGQGFFINTVSDDMVTNSFNEPVQIHGGEIIFNNSQRIFMSEADRSKSVFHSVERKNLNSSITGNESPEPDRMQLWITFKSPGGYHRQLLVTKDSETTSGFDLGYDATLIENNKEDMYWLMGENQVALVIQGVPDFSNERILPLGLKIATEGEFQIAIDEMVDIPKELPIFIKDNTTETYHDLRKSDFITTSEVGEIHDRYSIVFSEPQDPETEEGDTEDSEENEEDGDNDGEGSEDGEGDNGGSEGDGEGSEGEEGNAGSPEEPQPTPPAEIELLYSNGENNFIIRNPEELAIEKAILYNALGQEMYIYGNIPNQKITELPVTVSSTGVYFIRVHLKESTKSLKFVVE